MPVKVLQALFVLTLTAAVLGNNAWGAGRGLALTVYKVKIQRGADLSLYANQLTINAKGQINVDQADFSLQQAHGPVTGHIQQLQGRDNGGPWTFASMRSYSKNTQISFGNGHYDSDRAIIKSNHVRIIDQAYSVTAPSGSFDLNKQTARLTGDIRGTVKP